MKSDAPIELKSAIGQFQVKEEEPGIYETGRNDRYQIESGNFGRVATQIMEDLMIHKFTLRQRLMIDVVLRMTYGYSRKEAIIKPGLFVKLTGVAREHCFVALRQLVAANVLKRSGHVWQYNKYAKEWNIGKRQNVTESVTKNDVTESVTNPDNVTESVTKSPAKCYRIGTTTKESIKERKNMSGKPDPTPKIKPEKPTNETPIWKDKTVSSVERWKAAAPIGRAWMMMDYLNEKTERRYEAIRPDGKTPTSGGKLILQLFKHGYTGNQICDVIDDRFKRWATDDKMQEFLRPGTLFRLSNFENYLGQVKR